ncbi:MAG: DUF72 domain-containing protein [Mycobacteriales bacterium]|nr:DUF72 domain-containing protein [Frankia sp.]
MPVLVGTSGWQYASWRERFYPRGVAQAKWLEFYAERFATVEVNNAFYRLPEAQTFTKWAQRTPADFVVGVKASRYLTHIKRLRAPAEPVARFMQRARNLGPKLGPILLQLPPTMPQSLDDLDETLTLFGTQVRVAVEFRHASWWADETYDVLRRHGAALVLADRESEPIAPLERTADWGYVRFHSGDARPYPCYSRRALAMWVARLAELWTPAETVYAYFNNDPEGCAIRDAVVFAAEVSRHGGSPTRVPDPATVRVGVLR